jgi:predicted methyltransferase
VLAAGHVRPLLRAYEAGQDVAETSLDLGLTRVSVPLLAAGARLPAGREQRHGDSGATRGRDLLVPWDALRRVAAATTAGGGWRCFAVHPATEDGAGDGGGRDGRGAPGAADLREIQVFSPETNRRYSLLATAGAPTMLVSGVQMHRTAGQDPWSDTLAKVRCAAPLVGEVLDTCTGLGYTAVVAAATAASVLTVELDPAAVEVARQNPWSRSLFDHPRIERRIGDSAEVVDDLPDGRFSRVIHDPPVFGLAGDLYAGAFYRQLYRVLGRGGRMFHYVGNVASGSGQRVTRGVTQRLREAGFSRVVPRPEAFGVLAVK